MEILSTVSQSLTGKKIVLVGGAGLIGRVLARAIGECGADLVVVDGNCQALTELEVEFRDFGVKVQTIPMAVETRADVFHLLEATRDAGRHIQGLVVCAYPARSQTGESGHADFSTKLATHAGLFFNLNEIFAEYFSERDGGSIVNLSSIYGSIAPRFELYSGTQMTVPPDYVAAKAAVNALTRFFAAAYKKNAVRFNAVAPGGVADGQPASFQNAYDAMCGEIGLLQPEHIAGLVIYLLSDSACAVTGQVVTIDDGWSL